MSYFLDTNICVYFLNGRYLSVQKALRRLRPEQVKISAIVKAELMYGVQKSQQKEANMEKLEQFLLPFEVVGFSDACSEVYGALRGSLDGKGIGVGPHDLLIAATVLQHKGTLITHNLKEFSRIKGLRVEDWVK